MICIMLWTLSAKCVEKRSEPNQIAPRPSSLRIFLVHINLYQVSTRERPSVGVLVGVDGVGPLLCPLFSDGGMSTRRALGGLTTLTHHTTSAALNKQKNEQNRAPRRCCQGEPCR